MRDDWADRMRQLPHHHPRTRLGLAQLPPSPRQQLVLDYILAHIGERGRPPTYRTIGDAFGLRSTNAVATILGALEAKGAIALDPTGYGTVRAIRIPGVRWVPVPLEAGRVDVRAAGVEPA